MATIFSTARQTSLMYQIANRGLAFGRLSNANTQNSFWGERRTSSRDNKYNAFSALYGSGPQIGRLLKQYSAAQKQFNTEADKTTANLKKSAAALKSADFNVNGQTAAETDANTKAVLGKVNDFVNQYNDAVKFFDSNADVSSRVGRMADTFKEERYFSRSLQSVGVTTDAATGQLKVDNDRLTEALKKSPKTVEAVLGKNGLAGRAEARANQATFQKGQLFPGVESLVGKKAVDPTQLNYSNRALLQQANYNRLGTLLNLYF